MDNKPKNRKKVCVVDDEDSIRDIYKTALEQSGYDVVTAIDGEDGLKVVRQEKPDVVLIDIMMPKIDGLEMMKTLRSDENFFDIPIIVMTNVDDQKIVKEAGKLNTQFYLVKSLFEPKKVVNIIEEVLHNI